MRVAYILYVFNMSNKVIFFQFSNENRNLVYDIQKIIMIEENNRASVHHTLMNHSI